MKSRRDDELEEGDTDPLVYINEGNLSRDKTCIVPYSLAAVAVCASFQ